jgi:hypothetical protein
MAIEYLGSEVKPMSIHDVSLAKLSYHDAEIRSISTDRLAATCRLEFLHVDGGHSVMALSSVHVCRVQDFVLQNVVSRILRSSAQDFSAEGIRYWLTWASSLTDAGSWMKADRLEAWVAAIQRGETELMVFEPSAGAEIAVLFDQLCIRDCRSDWHDVVLGGLTGTGVRRMNLMRGTDMHFIESRLLGVLIDEAGTEVAVSIVTPDGVRSVLNLHGVERLRVSDLRQQNVIEALTHWSHGASTTGLREAAFALMTGMTEQDCGAQQLAKVARDTEDRVIRGELEMIEITAIFGAQMLASFASMTVLPDNPSAQVP